MRKTAIGLALLGLMLIAVPALAQTEGTIEIFVDGVVRGQPGDVVRVYPIAPETGAVPENLIGATCSGTASTANNASAHDDNDFHLTSGTSTASIFDWEAVPGATTSMSGTLVLGPTITIDLELGSPTSSGGVLVVLTCAQPPPEETTTTTTTTVTTPPPIVTTTTTTTAPPPGETTTVPPPEGGVAAGGGGTAGGGFGALPWLAAGGFALLSAAAIYAGGQRKGSGRE